MRNTTEIKGIGESTTPSITADGSQVNPWHDQYGRTVSTNRNIVVDVTPTLDTAAYADEDLLFDATPIPNAVFQGGTSIIESVTIIDKAKEGGVFDLYFLDTGTSLGTIGDPEAMTDAMIASILSKVVISLGDYTALANGAVAIKAGSATTGFAGLKAILQPASATGTTIWVAAVSQSTPTYTTANNLLLRIGLKRN